MELESIFGGDTIQPVTVPAGDPSIGAGTDYGIAMTIADLDQLMFRVKNWTINQTGGIFDWWNAVGTGPGGIGILPGGILPNNNHWNGMTGEYFRPYDAPSATPWYDAQEKYPISFDPVLGGLWGLDVLANPALTSCVIDVSIIRFDGTHYYPMFQVRGSPSGGGAGAVISTLSGAGPSNGTLNILGKSTPTYGTAAGPYTLNWVVNASW